jgi:hypothetical protein
MNRTIKGDVRCVPQIDFLQQQITHGTEKSGIVDTGSSNCTLHGSRVDGGELPTVTESQLSVNARTVVLKPRVAHRNTKNEDPPGDSPFPIEPVSC